MHERELLATYCIGWCIKYTLLHRVLHLPGLFVVQFLIRICIDIVTNVCLITPTAHTDSSIAVVWNVGLLYAWLYPT
jgi:hypothetical protein